MKSPDVKKPLFSPAETARRTAAYIEKHPHLFRFSCVHIPAPGEQGCAIGIAAMLNGYTDTDYQNLEDYSLEIFGVGETTFYNELGRFNKNWYTGPATAARALRAYSERLVTAPLA